MSLLTVTPCWTLLSLAIMTPLARPHAADLIVPKGTSVEIDGSLGADEWKDAKVLKDGAVEYLIKFDGEFLNIAVRGLPKSILSLCIQTDDNTVRVFHASASLGEARYEVDPSSGGAFAKKKDFSWSCSDASAAKDTDAATQSRIAFLKEHGWLASTIARGAGQQEIKLRWKDFARSDSTIALTWNLFPAKAAGESSSRWPTDVKDDSVNASLCMGKAPNQAKWTVAGWAQVRRPD